MEHATATRACAACGRHNPREATFCMYCGTAVVLGAESALEVRKVVSVLFCDLVGSTAAGQRLDPEDVSGVLRRYYGTARSIVQSFGGVVEKFVGDGVFAVFGVPTVHEDDAERAVRAALAICAAATGLPGLGEDVLHVRCGVTTGETLVKSLVDKAAGEGFITGAAANLAGRLQALAPADGMVVDEQTFRRTREVFDYTELEPATVKGKDEPLRVFHARAARVRVGTELRLELPTALVGREAELLALAAAYDEVVATGRVGVVTICGEPGLGKSRLVTAFRDELLVRNPSTVWRIGRSLPYGDGVGVWALAEILRSHAGILTSDDADTVLAKLDDMLPDGPDRGWMKDRLLPILGFRSSSFAVREELFAAYEQFVELLARAGPAVVVFEDVHWADDALLAYLAQVATNPPAVPLLVVATTRPELLEHGGASVEAIARRVVHLAPLSDADTASLAAGLLEGAAPSAEVEEAILRHAGGNALYTGEFVRLLLDRGALVKHDGVWKLAEGESVVVPESTQALIAARLDILPAAESGVLGDAAVIGGTFWAGALAAMGRQPLPVVLEALEALGRRHLVTFTPGSTLAGEIELRFAHVLVRDGAYTRLTRRDRAEKHQAVVAWIEQTSGARVADHADTLAYHACAALDHRSVRDPRDDDLRATALRYSTLAAERNVAIDTKAAAAHLERALRLSESEGPAHTRLLALAGRIALQESRPDVAVHSLERAVAAYTEEGDLRGASRTMIPLAYVYMHLGSDRGLELADRAVALLKDRPSCIELLDALSLRAATRTVGGDPQAGIESAERAFAVARELGLGRPTSALGSRGLARFYLGDLDGLEDVREAARLGAARGEGRNAALVHHNLALLEQLAAGPAASLEDVERAVEFSQRRGLVEIVQIARTGALDALLDLGRFAELLVLAGELEEHAESVRSNYVLIYTRSALLRCWAHLGDRARSDETAAWLEGAARQTGAPEDFVAGLAACAIAYGRLGRSEVVRSLSEELLAAGAGSVWLLAPRLPGLVRALACAGDAALVARLIDSVTHPAPYALAAVAAAGGVLAELEHDPRAASASYAEGAERFAGLGVLPEQFLALRGLERALAATGDPSGAGLAAIAAAEVLAAMPSGDLLERVGENSGPAQPAA